jgi:hypothetical protein
MSLKIYNAFREAMLSKTDSWISFLSENVTLKGPLAEVEGKQLFVEVNTPFFASIQDSKLLKVVELGDTVITQIITEIALPNGQNISLNVSEWYQIEDGLIQSLTVYFDTFEFRNALA